jgi:hypothetical protein
MQYPRLRFLARAAGSALLASLGLAAQAQTFVSGPSVSSTGPGRYTVFARQSDGQLHALDQSQVVLPGVFGRPPAQYWQRTGWQPVPGASDINSDPDSTVDLWQQWVVALRSDNDCWYTTRPVSSAGPGDWSGTWSQCDSNSPRTFTSGISAAAVNYPDYGISAIHLFGRGTDNAIYHNTIYVWPGGSVGLGWTAVPGPVDDGTGDLEPVTTDFTSDPDAVAYAALDGVKVAVCAQRIPFWSPLGQSTGIHYCNRYSPSGDQWLAWWSKVTTSASENYTGPGLAPSLYQNHYDLYYALSVPLLPWLVAGERIGITGEAKTFPNRNVASGPDAATFADLFRAGAPSQIACARDTASQIQCSLWNGNAFGSWFAP